MASTPFAIKHPIPIRGGPNDKPRPPFIEIKRSMSRPADPDAPSFLTTIPPEIRNTIYEILFIRKDPVEIVDRKEKRQLPAWADLDDFIDDGPSDDHAAEVVATSLAHEKTHGFDQGISLLTVSRQVYHEAVAVLYGANTFCITAPMHRHNWAVDQINFACRFLRSVGSHLTLVKSVIIDVGRICPEECADDDIPDWLPLIGLVWSMPTDSLQVSFLDRGQRLSKRLHEPSEYSIDAESCAARWSKFYNVMVREDPLSIRKYGRFERLIQNIWNNKDFGEPGICTITFRSTAIGRRVSRSMNSNNMNRMLKWTDEEWSPSLEKLQGSMFQRIMNYAVRSEQTTIFDLDSRMITGYNSGLSRANTRTRRYFRWNYPRLNNITLVMNTKASRSTFDEFSCLSEWIQGPYGWLLHDVARSSTSEIDHCMHTLNLCYSIGSAALEETRTDVLPLILLTLGFDTRTFLHFSRSGTQHDENNDKNYEVQLQALRRKCFIILSEILLSGLKKPWEPELPQLWIDGRGALTEATFQTPSTARVSVSFRPSGNFPSNVDDVHTFGLQVIDDLNDRLGVGQYDRPWRTKREERPKSLLEFWKMLWRVDWLY